MKITIYEPKDKVMSKTVKLLLQIAQYIVAALLGAAGAGTAMTLLG